MKRLIALNTLAGFWSGTRRVDSFSSALCGTMVLIPGPA